ncbi:MAG: inorganic phosphate transporter [Campylobacterales bacterium]|nr:inorganic phosphate transporter [Campylobacterales bacterium]
MDMVFIILSITILAVIVFDFTNGFHDAADMVATAIASRAMTPGIAIALATFFTFIAPFTIGLAVADTVGSFVDISTVGKIEGECIVLAAVLSAITYNLVTWKLGLPSSSSNSLVGGLVGAGLYGVGNSSINWGIDSLLNGSLDGVVKIVAGLFISPLAGIVVGYFLMKLFVKLFSRFTLRTKKFFVWSQYLSVSWLAFSHGANDAQKGMAIIAMVLLASGYTQEFHVPTWSIILCSSAITLGTLFGGWSIIKTLGFGIIKVKLLHSFTDQVGSSFINSMATFVGAPTSTTQVVTATLLGTGAAQKPQHVRWQVARNILLSWFTNIPISAFIGVLYCMILIDII